METNRVKEIRKLRKMTQVELAHAVGVAQGSIQKLENGEISLDIKWMKNLALALDVKPYELLPEEWQPEEVSPEEREILRMIRKTTAPQTTDNRDIPTQAEPPAHSAPSPNSARKPTTNER